MLCIIIIIITDGTLPGNIGEGVIGGPDDDVIQISQSHHQILPVWRLIVQPSPVLLQWNPKKGEL